MNIDCQTLAARIQRLEPSADLTRVAQLCVVMAHLVEDPIRLADEQVLGEAWRNASLKIQLAADQQAAVAEELERLAQSDPGQFSADHVWTLIRAIKVLSQTLHLYSGEPALDV